MLRSATIWGRFATFFNDLEPFCSLLQRFGAVLLRSATVWCRFAMFCSDLLPSALLRCHFAHSAAIWGAAGQRRDSGGTAAGQRRDSGGTAAGQRRDSGGTTAGQRRDNGGTAAGQLRFRIDPGGSSIEDPQLRILTDP